MFRPSNLYAFCIASTHFDIKVRWYNLSSYTTQKAGDACEFNFARAVLKSNSKRQQRLACRKAKEEEEFDQS